MVKGATQLLAEYVSGARPSLLTPLARERIRRSVLDAVGVGVYGASRPIGATLSAAVGESSGECTILGSSARAGRHTAALANGSLIHSEDWDDVGGGGGHPSAVLLPGLLALSEVIPLTGERLMLSYLVGYEVASHVARMMTTGYAPLDRAWQPAAVIGPLGSAAACAVALGLDEPTTHHALALAPAFAGGLQGQFGTHGKPLQLGHAAWAGLLAATLAANGAKAEPRILERPNGFAQVYAPGAGLKYLEHDLAGPRYLESSADHVVGFGPLIKRWPFCGGNNPAVSALSRLLARRRLTDAEVVRVVVTSSVDRTRGALFRTDPTSGLEGKFSLAYNVALMVGYGEIKPHMYNDEFAAELRARGLMSKVDIRTEPHADHTVPTCTVEVHLRSGEVLRETIDGGGDWLDDAGTLEKFRWCVTQVLPQTAAAELERSLLQLDDLPDASVIVKGTAL